MDSTLIPQVIGLLHTNIISTPWGAYSLDLPIGAHNYSATTAVTGTIVDIFSMKRQQDDISQIAVGPHYDGGSQDSNLWPYDHWCNTLTNSATVALDEMFQRKKTNLNFKKWWKEIINTSQETSPKTHRYICCYKKNMLEKIHFCTS